MRECATCGGGADKDGRVFGLVRPGPIREHKITHILSLIKYSLSRDDDVFRDVQHLSIDVDDVDDQDIVVHFPRIVRFIDAGLAGSSSAPGAVLVHCAMGKSRSVSAVIAYLLWKYPVRFGRSDPATTGADAVAKALAWVRATRPIAEPNDGFMRQLEMWWDMGCPADDDDAVVKAPAYQRWLYKREVDDAARVGRAPDWIRFEDEETPEGAHGVGGGDGTELRCKKCRRLLATGRFIAPHQGRDRAERPGCPHFFIEALSWMRPVLEQGELDGRLVCPNAKCAASIGRYAWQGFKCSCGEWVAPAFSLQKSKVDKVDTHSRGAGSVADRLAALGIRSPPPATAAAAGTPGADAERRQGNL